MTKHNIPALRFDGFDGEWDEQPLSAIADRVQTKNTKLTSTLPLTISAVHGLVDQITYFNNRVASSNLTNYLLIHNGEFAYNKSYSEGYPVGAVKRLDGYDMGVLSSLYVVFRLLSERVVDSNFVLSFFETSKWHRYVEMQSAEGARNHGLLNISADTFMRVPVSLAPSLEEQRAVGELFSDLDALIEQHRDKHANLQQTKTALMQRMFPQDGADEPELRLSGFSGAWGSRTLSELTAINNGLDYKHLSEGDIPVYGTGGYMLSVDRALSYKTDAIGIGRKGTIDKPYLLRAPFWTVDTLFYVTARDGANLQFLLAQFQRVDWKSKNTATGVPSLTSVTIGQTSVSIPPTLEEQRAIGEVYSNLDALIAAEASYITQLTQAKTALLQRMFV